MARGRHYGSFAKGFSDSLIQMMKLSLMQQHYAALQRHYDAQEALWGSRGHKGAQSPEAIAAGEAAGRDWLKGGGGGGEGYSGGVSGKFWTPENQKHAYDYLMSTGKFSEYGAAGAVARMTREAPDGPTSVNPTSKAFGIAQWLGDRKTPIAGNTSFDDQLKYYAGADLDRPEQARAKEQFAKAASPEEGSYAAMHFERAGGYKESGGRSDVLLNSTPTLAVYNTVRGGGGKGDVTATAAASPSIKDATMDAGGGKGPNNIYANIPEIDSEGREQIPMFTRWNPDPIGNEKANLAQIDPQMQKVIARARADNPNLHFVLGSGKRSAADQDLAKSWDWSKVGSKDGGDAAVHMQGRAADLWALDENGRVTFDKGAQARVTAAIKAAAKKEHVNINAGGDWKNPDQPHFELKGKGSAQTAGNEGPPALHTSYQVAGPTGSVSEAGSEKAAATLVAHRADPDAPTGLDEDKDLRLPDEKLRDARLREAKRDSDLDVRAPEQDRTSGAALQQSRAEQFPAEQHRIITDPDVAKAWPGRDTPAYRPEDSMHYTDEGAGDVVQNTGAPYGGHSTNYGRPPFHSPPVPPDDPSIIARQKIRDRQQAGMPARPQSLDPMPPPLPQYGPPMPPHQMGPEGPGRTELPPEWSHMPAPGTRDEKGVYAPKPAIPASAADKPAPASHTVSATTPSQQVTPAGNQGGGLGPGLIQYRVPESSAARAPIYTAGDLSHLWGPNPPLPDRMPAPAPPASSMPTRLPDDVASNAAAGMQMGARKGGPIQRFANGGAIPQRPMMRFQGGGYAGAAGYNPTLAGRTSPASATNTPYMTFQPAAGQPMPTVMGQPMGGTNATFNPDKAAGYQPWHSGLEWLASQPTSPNTTANMSGQQIADDINALSPGQQQWYNQQMANARAAGPGNWYYNPASLPAAPAAATPAPAAAAPAPTVINPPSVQNITNYPAANDVTSDPTTTTTTGTVGTPSAITAKTYDPNQIGTTGSGSATDATGGTNYSVTDKDETKQILSRRGGPIQRFANGGIPQRPTMGFAAGGMTGMQYMMQPQSTYVGPLTGGGWSGTPYDKLAPNQQTWADTTRGLLDQMRAGGQKDYAYWSGGGQNMTGPVDTSQFMNQFTAMPDAIWPTTPSAPTPLNQPPPSVSTVTQPQVDITGIDPTTTTTTGTPGTPDAVSAKTYDPNQIGTTGSGSATDSTGGTNYSVTDKGLTQQILSRRGGPITRMGYDDGGGVSGTVAGMPPGLSQGGQQPIPPVYFNPATYAPAGAPVGKGITQTSAPTFVAGAIPSLPMLKGGAVRFDEGGSVSDAELDTSNEQMQMARDDQMTEQLLAQDEAAPTSAAQGGYFTPQDVQAQSSTQGPPPGAAPWTPEISDGGGNPSKGLIGALTAGLHWLGEHFGLVGGAQAHPAIATSPEIQDNRANHAAGQIVGGFDKSHHDELGNMIVPRKGTLDEAEYNIAVMEGTYKYLLSQGDDANASKMAASILQYSVQTSQKYAEEAAKQLYDGNLKGAVDNINYASDAIPDGRKVHVHLNDDGTAIVTGKDLNGRTLWQQKGAAMAILQYATNRGRTGQMQWDALESQAAKYDSTFKEMATNRQKNMVDQAKEDEAAAAEGRVAGTGAGEPLMPVTQPAITPAGNQPALPGSPKHFRILPDEAHSPQEIDDTTAPAAPAAPAGTASPESAAASPAPGPATQPGPSPGRSPDTTTAQQAAPPPDADSGYAASSLPGLPTQPGPAQIGQERQPRSVAADVPAAEAQPVSFEDAVSQINAQETRANNSDIQRIQAGYYETGQDGKFTGNIRYGGQVYARPRPPDLSHIKTKAEQAEALARWKANQLDPFNAMVKSNDENMKREIAENKDLRSKQFQTLRDRAKEKFSIEQQQRGADLATDRQEKMKGEERTYTEEAPMTPQVRGETYKDTTPVAVTALLPRYAYDDSGNPLDAQAAAQRMGKAYDLPPAPGQPATGGLQRANVVSNIASDAVTWNQHMGRESVHDLIDGLARGIYKTADRPTTVTRHGQEMDKFVIHQQFDQDNRPLDPGVTLFLPRQDGYQIARIAKQFADAKPKPAPAPTQEAPAPTQETPAPAVPPRPTVKPIIQSKPGEESGIKLPPRVPVEQMPPEERALYPELNQ